MMSIERKWRRLRTVCLAFLFALLAEGGQLAAWGPATHAKHYDSILRTRPADPGLKRLARAVASHKADFIYGSVFPDIRIMARKRKSGTARVTHSMTFALSLMRSARTDAQLAFAFGNLSHIAEDSIQQVLATPMIIADRHFGPDAFLIAEDILEGETEIRHGDYDSLKWAVLHKSKGLARFYFDQIGRDQADMPFRDFARMVADYDKWLLVVYGKTLRVAAAADQRLGFVDFLTPKPEKRSAHGGPVGYFDLGAKAAWDLALNGRNSKWEKWPLWSDIALRYASYFSTSPTSHAWRGHPWRRHPWSCSHGVVVFKGWFAGPEGRRTRLIGKGMREAVLHLRLHASKPQTVAVKVLVYALLADGSCAYVSSCKPDGGMDWQSPQISRAKLVFPVSPRIRGKIVTGYFAVIVPKAYMGEVVEADLKLPHDPTKLHPPIWIPVEPRALSSPLSGETPKKNP